MQCKRFDHARIIEVNPGKNMVAILLLLLRALLLESPID
jgi:hypothetical protein